MPQSAEREKYTMSLNALGIPRDKDPFPFDPPELVDYWADNKDILQKIVQTQMDSVMFASSFMYVLHGPIGGGKTFAVKYLANPKIQELIKTSLKKPEFKPINIHVTAIAPLRTGQLTFSLHKDIVEKCFSAILGSEELVKIFVKAKPLGIGRIKGAFGNIKKSVTRYLDGTVGVKNIEKTEGYKFLTQTRSRLGKLQDVNDLVETIRILVKILSEKYGRIIISIDELENLRRATGTDRVLCNDFLRRMHDVIDHDMTLFLIFTFESFEEVTQLLLPALISRVKEFIEFPFVRDRSDVKEYITECILQRCDIDPYDIIEEQVVDDISNSLITNSKGRLSFRQINREMYKVFLNTYIHSNQTKYKIDFALYKKAVKGITAEDVVKRIRGKLPKKKGDEK